MVIPEPVMQAISLLNQSGYEAYLVGGCVRDAVMHIPPHDYDLTTSATPSEMQKVFAAFRTIETGLKHGTLTVLMDEYPLEITTFRLDGEYLDNRHPKEVIFTRKLENDLSRRDFTINAMAYHPDEGLVDLFSGQEDCKKKILRCVGPAATRFEEDALRILRALRFAARLQFAIEKRTASAIFDKKELLHHISAERIAVELNGLLLADGAVPILEQFADVLFTVLPSLRTERWAVSLSALARTPKELPLRWAALLHPLGEENARQIMQKLKVSNQLRDTVCALVQYHALKLTEENMQLRLMQVGDALILPLIQLQDSLAAAKNTSFDTGNLQKKAKQLMDSGACYTLSRLAVSGSDLAAIGIRGPAIGQMLHHLLEQVASGKAENKKETLLETAQTIIR